MSTQIRSASLAWVTILCLALSASSIAGNTMTDPPQTNASTASSPQTESAASQDNAARGAFAVILVKSLDSKKLKDGDLAICQTAGTMRFRGGLLIPSGAKVTAHVKRATARSKGDTDSTLSLVFDKIEISKGKELLMKGVLEAIAPTLSNSAPVSFAIGTSGNSGAGGNAPPVQPLQQNFPAGSNVHPLLNSQSVGVLGIHNLEMDKNSVLTSNGKEVKLDSGTQMMVRAEIQVPVQ